MADIWSGLPLLPLKHVLRQLSLEDALAATSACRSWRNALSLYEGKREQLKLNSSSPERSHFLAKLFRRSTRKLHIHLDRSKGADEYLQDILTKFHDTALLHELVIAGPAYSDLRMPATLLKIKRSTVESMLHAHRHTLQNIAFVGCELSSLNDATSGDTAELSGNTVPINEAQPAPFLSKATVKNMQFSSLQSVNLEYSELNPQLLEAFCTLPHLSRLSLNLLNGAGKKFEPLPWMVLENKASPLEVSVNIIGVPCERFDEIMENVLVDNLPLVALRVLFCKVMHEPFLLHILKYDKLLRALHWADSAALGACGAVRAVDAPRHDHARAVNPLHLLCWQCVKLADLVIHGYWVWQYDLLGMARLRHSTLQRFTVSATYQRDQEDLCCKREHMRPVLAMDKMPAVKQAYIEQINLCLEFDWQPVKKLSAVHPAIGPKSTTKDRAEYVLQNTMEVYGVT